MCDIWLVDLSPGLRKFKKMRKFSPRLVLFHHLPSLCAIFFVFFLLPLIFRDFAVISFIFWEKRPGKQKSSWHLKCQDVRHLAQGTRCGREQGLLMLASSTHVLEGAKGKKGLAKSSTFVSLPVIPSRKGRRRDHDSWTKTCISETRLMCAE